MEDRQAGVGRAVRDGAQQLVAGIGGIGKGGRDAALILSEDIDAKAAARMENFVHAPAARQPKRDDGGRERH